MKNLKTLGLLALIAGAMSLSAAAPAAAAGTVCRITYNLKGWSAFYKTAKGKGTITCENGQTANVSLVGKGGGLTAGKSEIRDGDGKFNEVADISELFGTYVQANATAGAVNAALFAASILALTDPAVAARLAAFRAAQTAKVLANQAELPA